MSSRAVEAARANRLETSIYSHGFGTSSQSEIGSSRAGEAGKEYSTRSVWEARAAPTDRGDAIPPGLAPPWLHVSQSRVH